MKTMKIILLQLLVLFQVVACSQLDDFNDAEFTYFMPDVDVFIVRAQENMVQDPVRYRIASGESPVLFVLRTLTGNDENSLNHYFSQMGTAFYHSRIRIFYIQMNAFNSDTMLQEMSTRTSFNLTNDAGNTVKGTVYNEDGPLKIFLIGDTSDGAPYRGLGYIGIPGVLIIGGNPGETSNFNFTKVLAHELGHNYGLHHPFDDYGDPNPDSCDGASQGTTNRIMDYVSPQRMQVYAPCERFIGIVWAQTRGLQRRMYRDGDNPEIQLYIGDWAGSITVGSPGKSPKIDPLTRVAVD